MLGRFQDRTVQTALLRSSTDELVTLPGGPDAVLAVGLLISALEADQRAARDAFASSEQRKLVRTTFRKAKRV